MKIILFTLFTVLITIPNFVQAAKNASAGEEVLIAVGRSIQISQISDFEDHPAAYSDARGRKHRIVIGSTLDANNFESRSLIDFSEDGEVLAYSFEKIQGKHVVTHKFYSGGGALPTIPVKLRGFKHEYEDKDQCETQYTRTEYELRDRKLYGRAIEPTESYCASTEGDIYQELTQNDDRETIGHMILKADFSVPEFGRGYRDPSGLIWSHVQIDSLAHFLEFSNRDQAQAHCQSKASRLPTPAEAQRIVDGINDPTRYSPVYTLKSWEQNGPHIPGSFVYNSKIAPIIPGFGIGWGRTWTVVYTDDPNIVWNTDYKLVVDKNSFYSSDYRATICVKQREN